MMYGIKGGFLFSDGAVHMTAYPLRASSKAKEGESLFGEGTGSSVVWEGTLYNRMELQEKLGTAKPLSDEEILLSIYQRDGTNCFNQLDGMFACAIWDKQRGKLLLARDRAGEKPLYFYSSKQRFCFSSDLNDLMAGGGVPKQLSHTALCQYLQLGYLFAPLTMYQDVWALEPGCYLSVNAQGQVEHGNYWDMECKTENLVEDYTICKETLRNNLIESVEQRLESAQPNGVFLSGGIDSTVIAGIAAKLLNRKIDTFTIGFLIKAYDESDRAQIAAEAFQTRHHLLTLDYDDALDKIGTIISGMGQPFADPSSIPTYIINEYAKQFLDVVLTGDASDQMMAGSNRYLIHHYVEMYCKIPGFLRKGVIERIVRAMPDSSSLTRKIRKVIGSANMDDFEQRKRMMSQMFREEELSQLLIESADAPESLLRVKELYDRWEGQTDELSRTLYTDIKVVVEGGMLAKMGSMSRMVGLETRVPMVSKKMLDFNARIPSGFKLKGKTGKYILRDAFSDVIPERLMSASKKGFGVPLDSWFRGPLKEPLLKALDRDAIEAQGNFQYPYIEKILDDHFSKRANRADALWALYVFQTWYQREFGI